MSNNLRFTLAITLGAGLVLGLLLGKTMAPPRAAEIALNAEVAAYLQNKIQELQVRLAETNCGSLESRLQSAQNKLSELERLVQVRTQARPGVPAGTAGMTGDQMRDAEMRVIREQAERLCADSFKAASPRDAQ